jgi:alpha-L-arabinofuranosidase
MNRRRFLKVAGMAAAGAAGMDRVAKALTVPLSLPAARGHSSRVSLAVVTDEPLGKLNRNILGDFSEHLGACIYDGMWVGTSSSIPNTDGVRNDTAEALRSIQAPIMRWPGGCFADTYHWRDGIGPREKRPSTWNLWWGREEPNAFGTDEFIEYCKLSGVSPYICVNVGSGTVREAIEWMQYCNSDDSITVAKERAANGHPAPYGVKYWSIGNESWGCGGNFAPGDYADRYAEFVTYLARAAGRTKVEFVACGSDGGDWNQKFFERLLNRPGIYRVAHVVNQLSIHHYFRNGPGVGFTDEQYYGLLAAVADLEGILRRTIGVIDEFTEPEHGSVWIALDEWGVWHPTPSQGNEALLQPNTLRDAMLAAAVLNSLNSFGNRISMGCIAQTFNVLQCMAFTRGPQMVLTPTYYAFGLFQPHMDATGLRTVVDSPQFEAAVHRPFTPFPLPAMSRPYLSTSASRDQAGKKVCLTLANQHLTDELEVEIELLGGASASGGTMRELTSASVQDHNTFENPDAIKAPAERRLTLSGRKFVHTIPAHSIQSLVLNLG